MRLDHLFLSSHRVNDEVIVVDVYVLGSVYVKNRVTAPLDHTGCRCFSWWVVRSYQDSFALRCERFAFSVVAGDGVRFWCEFRLLLPNEFLQILTVNEVGVFALGWLCGRRQLLSRSCLLGSLSNAVADSLRV